MADRPDTIDSAQTVQRTPSVPELPAAGIPQGEARYEMLGVLGEGGMGRVVEAFDRQFSRVVAIKELRGSGGDAARLQTEALVTGNLEHPGVPPVYERGQRPDGSPFYVMRRVRGRALEDALHDAGDLPGRLALLSTLTRAAQTLGFAHERGVVHRDVKPQNIMVGTHGEVFVVDWGLARASTFSSASGDADPQPGPAPQKTLMGAVMGTPAYMAPEQARGDVASIDARTDVFALGAVLYRLLAGRPPYAGGSTAQVVESARRGEHPDIDTLAGDAPAPLREICRTAMALEPARRFATAQHLADALESFASTAVTRAYEKTAGRSTAVAVLFGIGAVAFGILGLARFAPRELVGSHAVFSVSFLAIALWLAWLELRSKGRLGLAPLGYGAAATTLITGFISTGIIVAERTSTPGFDWTSVVREAAVGLTLSGLLAALALGAWGFVLYRRAR